MMHARAFSTLLTGVLLASSLSSTAQADDTALQYRLIQLQADASREVQNDEMQAVLYTEQNNNNPTQLARDVANVLNQAISTGKSFANVQISSGSQNTYPIYNDKNKLTGWRTRAEVHIKSTDFKAASEVVAKLQSSMQLENIRFSVSNTQRQRVENELLSEVSQAFQQRARTLQQAWNANSYELVRLDINSSSEQPPAYPMMYARAASMKMEDAVPAQAVEAGNSQIRVSASGSIQLGK